jgi:phosphoribosylformylglycinamidine (FGAM) synthase-like enzyme
MFARVEVTLKPDLPDHTTTPLLRKIEAADPELRKCIRWARKLDVYWMDLPISREELILSLNEVLWDPVLNWLFTGNLIPSAAGARGGLEDLLETSPNRPGQFFAIEKRLRLGTSDLRANTLLKDFEVTLKRSLPEARICSGALLILEGAGLNEERLSAVAREYFANEVQESWTLVPAKEFQNSERFFAERVKREMPRPPMRSEFLSGGPREEEIQDEDVFLEKLSRRGFPFSDSQLEKTKSFYQESESRAPMPLEVELIASLMKSKNQAQLMDQEVVLGAGVLSGMEYGKKTIHLFQDTFLQSSKDNPRSWMLTNFEKGRPAILGVDEEEALILRVGLESDKLDQNSLRAGERIVAGTLGKVISEEKGARPLFIQNVIQGDVPERGVVARRVFDGLKTGIARTSLELGVPVLGGSLEVGTERKLAPSVGVFAVGSLPRSSIDLDRDFKRAENGEKVFLLAPPFERDQKNSFDCLYFKRMQDFILEGMERNYFLSHYFLGDRTLAEGAVDFSDRLGGIALHLDRVVCVAGKPTSATELLSSVRMERLFIRVNPEEKNAVIDLAKRREVHLTDVGNFLGESKVSFYENETRVARVDSQLFAKLLSSDSRQATWAPKEKNRPIVFGSVKESGLESLLKLLSHPNLCSREWLSLEFDQEVQGASVLKPFHTVSQPSESAFAGPNDGIVVRSKPLSGHGIVAALGSHSRWTEIDPYYAGLLSVDEAVRNALSSGADYGKEDSLFALSYLLQVPELPHSVSVESVENSNGQLVRLLLGSYFASKELELPFVSGMDAKVEGENAALRLQVQSMSKVSKVAGTRSADFKGVSDQIYLLGHAQFSLIGSLVAELKKGLPEDAVPPMADWSTARRLYSWLGGAIGKEQKKLRSIHDVSDGGLLVAISEGILARNFGASIQFPEGLSETMEWEFLFGEGFHGIIVTVMEPETAMVEAEWLSHEIPFCRLGQVLQNGVLQVKRDEKNLFAVETRVLRQAWKKEGYWE